MIAALALALVPVQEHVQEPVQDHLELCGRVVHAGGAPAPGALVWATTDPDGYESPPRVLARVPCDAEGRFRVQIAADLFGPAGSRHLGLLAHAAGAGLAAVNYEPADLPVGLELELVLPAPGEAQPLRVLDPAGAPVPGARIAPTHLAGGGPRITLLPAELRQRLAAITDGHGVARVTTWSVQDAVVLEVEAEGFGAQRLRERMRLAPGWARGADLVLAEVAPATVDLPDLPDQGVPLRLIETSRTSAGNEERSSSLHREHRLSPGEDPPPGFGFGWGHVSALVEGPPIVLRLIQSVDTESGPGARTVLQLVEGVRVHGRAVDADTGAPVAGVRLRVRTATGRSVVESDAQGEYSFHVAPGYVAIERVLAAPDHDVPRVEHLQGFSQRVEADALELPLLALAPRRALTGSVVDAAGRAVPGAWVTAHLLVPLGQGRGWLNETSHALADESGRFTLGGVGASDGTVQLVARRGNARSLERLEVPVTSSAPIELRIDHLLSAAGRVLDADGAPVSGARVTFHRESPPEVSGGEKQIPLGSAQAVVTDEEGSFRIPPAFEPGARFVAIVAGRDIDTLRSRFRSAEEWQAQASILTAARRLTARGTLLDEAGRPLVDARVFVAGGSSLPGEVRTDGDGRFELAGLGAHDGFLFVDLGPAGFHGLRVASNAPFTWRLGAGEGEGRPASAPGAPRAWELDTAAGLLGHALERARAGGTSERLVVLEALAVLDPSSALAELEAGTLQGWMADRVRGVAVRALARSAPGEARSIAEAITDPDGAASRLQELAAALPTEARAEKLDLLGVALARARGIAGPDQRLLELGRIAGQLFDLGEEALARELFRRGQELAADLPAAEWPGYARGEFARELVRVDPEAAVALVEETTEESDRQRYRRFLIGALAARDPARCAELLASTAETTALEPLVCARMAAVDLARARGIAQHSQARAECFGRMAGALADAQPEVARELLAEAFSALARRGVDPFPALRRHHSAKVAAVLLPVAERIAPERFEEYLWRALALRPAPPEQPFSYTGHDDLYAIDGTLAFYVAAYDPELARALLAPALAALRGTDEPGWLWRGVFAALAVVDPDEARARQDELPVEAAAIVGRLLALTPEEREAFARSTYHGLWSDD